MNGKDGKSIVDVQIEGQFDDASEAKNTYDCIDEDGNVVGSFIVANGAQGKIGKSIKSVELVGELDESDGAINTYNCIDEDDNVIGTFSVTNGHQGIPGKSVKSIVLAGNYDSSDEAVNVYNCIDSDDQVIGTIEVTNGHKGSDANINVVEDPVSTGETPKITVTEETINGVKTYRIGAVLPQAGESITITPELLLHLPR